ncbi:LPXTG-motif cell wall-anchored protein [Microbacteriaceae bacterium SG_E_30_P1]|uniref:LPXTG-motif cell wall-anchored protein n=1 Tax=Antiquaquibacter oligotrophicus TaxID=2880260 RepID=A0ABT6KN50_9MICO|nr:LPXTG cell wall anchor domain-containing protein [Antiquaquibacter oligotrophicus]MDH6181180.1 LPXTG-motif cell wall-anchored protein [Antiquaquibacter oligotrophicus]UDF13125.1 LPXTG cell wall anchor domain-containing protein [Antiquaquibacter oligotrophicus]
MPELASTGADLASLLPWIIGAAVIVVAGGVLLILRGRRKPTAPAPEAPTSESTPGDQL